MPAGYALAGVACYNHDQEVIYPQVLVASGVAAGPEPVANAFPVASIVNGVSSGWSELEFSDPVAAANEGFYIVFRLPEGSVYADNGYGGGAGLGYTEGPNGFTGWFTQNGEDWIALDERFGMALVPSIIPAEEGMVEKRMDEEMEPPVTHTAFLYSAPNPFNPQTELRFQLKNGSEVDLSIYNVKGERVIRLVDGYYPTGRHSVVWTGRDGSGRRQASGAYFARFSADGVVQTQRLLLVK
jgi:hypothetical protein